MLHYTYVYSYSDEVRLEGSPLVCLFYPCHLDAQLLPPIS